LNLFDTLDVDGDGSIDIEELCEGISKLRGDARKSDVVALNLMVQKLHQEMRNHMDTTLKVLQAHEFAMNLQVPSSRSRSNTGGMVSSFGRERNAKENSKALEDDNDLQRLRV